MKRRDSMSNNELRYEICNRSYPDLYMDVFEIVKDIPRSGLLKLLAGMDLDDQEGRKGSLRTRPPMPGSS